MGYVLRSLQQHLFEQPRFQHCYNNYYSCSHHSILQMQSTHNTCTTQVSPKFKSFNNKCQSLEMCTSSTIDAYTFLITHFTIMKKFDCVLMFNILHTAVTKTNANLKKKVLETCLQIVIFSHNDKCYSKKILRHTYR